MKSLFDECFESSPLPTDSVPTQEKSHKIGILVILGITGAVILIIVVILALVYIFVIKKKKPVIKKIGYLPGYGSSCADTTNSTSTVQGKSSFSSKNY